MGRIRITLALVRPFEHVSFYSSPQTPSSPLLTTISLMSKPLSSRHCKPHLRALALTDKPHLETPSCPLFQSLLDLHVVASNHNDPHLTNFLEGEFLEEQVEAIKELADLVTRLNRAGPTGLGEHIFDKQMCEREE